MTNGRHRRNHNSRAILLAILIGFSVIALIEILYGQKQVRAERARMELEEENKKIIEELQKELDYYKEEEAKRQEQELQAATPVPDADSLVEEFSNITSNYEAQIDDTLEVKTEGTAVVPSTDESKYDLQIVLLGDSIIGNDRGDNGVAGCLADACNAKIYNLGIGGTSAGLLPLPKEEYNYNNWSSIGLLGVVNAMVGNIDNQIFADYKEMYEALVECDFNQTDYFVIEYGINDFLSGKIPLSRYQADGSVLPIDDVHTYVGAMNTAINMLQTNYPNAKIMVVSPHYCQFFSGETYLGDSYTFNLGYGTLIEFSRCATNVYEQNSANGVLFYDAFNESGINAETADKYLEDGIHLSAEGRRVYADYLARLISSDYHPVE